MQQPRIFISSFYGFALGKFRIKPALITVAHARIGSAFGFVESPLETAMNWEMISAVGRMLGAIGVIISIIYLAAKIRNQNKENRRAAMNVLTTHWSDLNRSLVENPELATLWIRALRSFDELDGARRS